jgi:hypothetical protein
MTFMVEGEGNLEVWLYQYDADGGYNTRRIWDAVLTQKKGARKAAIQARLRPDTVSYRVMANNSGSAKGYARVRGVRNCAVQYEADKAHVPAILSASVDTQNKTSSLAPKLLKSFTLSPVTSRKHLKDAGTRIQFGTDCGHLGWFCRTLSVEGPSGALLVHPTRTQGVSIRLPIASGFTLFTDKPARSIRTHWQCRIGRLVWFAARSPGRKGRLSKAYLRLLKSQLPELRDPDAPRTNLEITLHAGINSTINTSLLWRDSKGRKNCTYLGEKAMENAEETLVWRFPLPKEARDINLALTTNHGLNEYLNMRIEKARLLVNSPSGNNNKAAGSQ